MAEMACGGLDEDLVVLVLTDPLSSQDEELTQRGTSVSVSDIHDWNLSQILSCSIIKVEANRSRLMQQSSYFRSLLGGSFSESSLHHVVVQWNLEVIVTVLQFMYGVSINVTPHSLLPLLEGALFFGVENLLLECENWYRKFTSETGNYTLQMPLDALIEIWNFGSDHGIGFVQEMCKDYLARNFAWTMSSSSFAKIPYALLYSCIGDSHLTVESEMQLCEAILNWLSINSGLSVDCVTDYCHILKKVRICLLPLWFAAGKRRHFFKFADKCVSAIIYLIENYPTSLLHAVPDGVLDSYKFRLTKYSKKVVLSGCPQITVAFLILAALPFDIDDKLKTRIINSLIDIDYRRGDGRLFDKSFQIVPFESVHELDISKCPKIQLGAAVRWLHLVFPSLRILKASYSMDFEMDHLFYIVRNCCHIHEVDLTVDISPVIPMMVSILSACTEEYGLPKPTRYKLLKEDFVTLEKSLSSITKLSLEGQSDSNDSDLLNISSLSGSLCYLNIMGCTLVTDFGISKLLCKCLKIKSVILSYTSFGKNSVLTLCSDNMTLGASSGGRDCNSSGTMAYRLQQLQINGCKDVDQDSMIKLMGHVYMLKILSLEETSLVDDALFGFKGCSLEEFYISETKVSMQALAFIMRSNPNVKYLKATGCKNLHQHGSNSRIPGVEASHYDLLAELARIPTMEEAALGWGFSTMALEKLETTFGKLKAITLGLGASLDHDALCVLPEICPLLERVILTFQVVSDDTLRCLLGSLKYLQELGLICCLGALTSYSFQIGMPNLRVLRLKWVTPWMTNHDLVILTQNCSNLVELSLSGCKLLDSDSQDIISSGWPGLMVIHLEDCGKITANGVCSLFDCKAVENLLLRHNGQGIGRNFVVHAASQLPLLRKLALDLCDACDGGFESPSYAERFCLSHVRISCCKSQRCGLEFGEKKFFKPVHKETIVLEWNRKELRTTVVKERI